MSKILAIDYGSKRTGLALSDASQIFAFPLVAIATNDLMQYLEKCIQEEQIEVLVVGHPRKLNGEDCQIENNIQKFITKLKITHPHLSINRVDERFTSKIAFQSLIEGGVKKKRRREDKYLVDKASATLILQSYLSRIKI